MYVVLNLQKCKSFITKGIHLTPFRPTAQIPPDFEPRFMDQVLEGIRDGRLLDAGDGSEFGLTVQGQVAIEPVAESETNKTLTMTKRQDVDEFGKPILVLQFPDEKGEVDETPVRPRIIMTGIIDEHDE